jgi:hypothetical protein
VERVQRVKKGEDEHVSPMGEWLRFQILSFFDNLFLVISSKVHPLCKGCGKFLVIIEKECTFAAKIRERHE